MEYTVSLRYLDTEPTQNPDKEITISAPSIWEALEEALWEYGHDYWILAIEPADGHEGNWTLTDTRMGDGSTYPTKEEAIANGDDGVEVMIAIPKYQEA